MDKIRLKSGRGEFENIVKAYSGEMRIVCGHVHSIMISEIDSTTIISGSSLCSSFCSILSMMQLSVSWTLVRDASYTDGKKVFSLLSLITVWAAECFSFSSFLSCKKVLLDLVNN